MRGQSFKGGVQQHLPSFFGRYSLVLPVKRLRFEDVQRQSVLVLGHISRGKAGSVQHQCRLADAKELGV